MQQLRSRCGDDLWRGALEKLEPRVLLSAAAQRIEPERFNGDLVPNWMAGYSIPAVEGRTYAVRLRKTVEEGDDLIADIITTAEYVEYVEQVWGRSPTSAKLRFTAAETGEYVLRVEKGIVDIDVYELPLESPVREAVPLDLSASGSIDWPFDVRRHLFSADADAVYFLQVAGGTLADGILRFYDARTGTLVAEADDAEWDDVPNPIVQFAPPGAGEYIVEVSGWSAGEYTLSISEARDDHPETFTTVGSLSEPITGTLDAAGDGDFFRLPMRKGNAYRITSQMDWGFFLYPPGEGCVDQRKQRACRSVSEYTFIAQVDGPADVAVGEPLFWFIPPGFGGANAGWPRDTYGLGAGLFLSIPYHIAVSEIAFDRPESSAPLLLSGQTIEDTIDASGEVHWYRFSAVKGSEYSFFDPDKRRYSSVDVSFRVYNAAGEDVTGTEDNSFLGTVTDWVAPGSEDYYLAVTAFNPAGYRFAMEEFIDDQAGVPALLEIDAATPSTGIFDYVYDEDEFVFHAEAGQTYTILSSGTELELYMEGPDGLVYVDEDMSGGHYTFTAGESGVYTITLYNEAYRIRPYEIRVVLGSVGGTDEDDPPAGDDEAGSEDDSGESWYEDSDFGDEEENEDDEDELWDEWVDLLEGEGAEDVLG